MSAQTTRPSLGNTYPNARRQGYLFPTILIPSNFQKSRSTDLANPNCHANVLAIAALTTSSISIPLNITQYCHSNHHHVLPPDSRGATAWSHIPRQSHHDVSPTLPSAEGPPGIRLSASHYGRRLPAPVPLFETSVVVISDLVHCAPATELEAIDKKPA